MLMMQRWTQYRLRSIDICRKKTLTYVNGFMTIIYKSKRWKIDREDWEGDEFAGLIADLSA